MKNNLFCIMKKKNFIEKSFEFLVKICIEFFNGKDKTSYFIKI